MNEENNEVTELLEMLEAWKGYIMKNDDYLTDLLIQEPVVMARAILGSGDPFLIDEVLRKASGKGLRERCHED